MCERISKYLIEEWKEIRKITWKQWVLAIVALNAVGASVAGSRLLVHWSGVFDEYSLWIMEFCLVGIGVGASLILIFNIFGWLKK